ncbi:MAG: helix-turn-helix transcriptional regulator [Candidatus Limnocylindria bacterium]
MRADRLVAALLVLQARGRVTAAELAAELEVSMKTARRDLEALAMAGIPVFAQVGRGGGWSLLGGARTDLSGLTAEEVRALFLLAGPAAPVAPEAKAALRKLVQALPEPFRARAAAAASAIVIDPARWGRDADPPPLHLALLERAVLDSVRVELAYESRDGHVSTREVDPLGLARKGVAWYLVAGTDAGVRTFRVDRITRAAVTGEPSERPEGFDLPSAWRESVERTEARRRRVPRDGQSGTEMPTRTARPVRRRPRRGPAVARRPRKVAVSRSSAEVIADELAGWGRDIEVVEPALVRRHLARIGAELVARYATTSGS